MKRLLWGPILALVFLGLACESKEPEATPSQSPVLTAAKATAATKPTQAVPSPAPTEDPVTAASNPIAEALETSGAALALDSQGNGLVAWTGQVGSGPPVDAAEIFVAPVSAGQAGTPVQITSDTYSDFGPQVVPLPDGTYLLTWDRTRTANLPDTDGLDVSFLQDLEIAYARFHPATGTADPPTYLTDNAYLDQDPHLAKSPDGSVLLVWTANPDNLLVGSDASPDHVMWSRWLGSSWSPPAEALTVSGDLSFDLAYGGTEAAVAFWQVQEGGQSDISVARFDGTSWGALQPITADEEKDTAPRLAFTADGKPFLLWRRDGQLVHVVGSWQTPFVAVGDTMESASAAGQQLAMLPNGDLVLVWEGMSDLFYRRWFSQQGQWGPMVPLTTDGLPRFVTAAAGGASGVTVAYLGEPASPDSLTSPLGLLTADADSAALPPAQTLPPATPPATPVRPTATRVPPTATPWASATPILETQPLPPPQDLGPVQAGGKALVTLSNDEPNTLTIAFNGPDGSTTFSYPPCPTCLKYNVAPASCPEKGYREVLRFTPGVYTVSVRADDPSIMPLAGTWDLHADTAYLGCWFSVEVHTSG